MEEEELNEEVLGDVDNVADAGDVNEASEEPVVDVMMQEQIDRLEQRISELQTSIATIIEAGATIMEPAAPDNTDEDSEEPFLYLEDLDYTI